jgi:nitroreductase
MESASMPNPNAAAIVESVVRARKAVRSFRPDAVCKDDVLQILDIARTAPSNSNTQPWQVYVLAGRAKRRLSDSLLRAHESGRHPPLVYMPDPLPDPYRRRQEAFGVRYYGTLGVDKSDIAERSRVTGRNFDFFGAPIGLIFTIDRCMTKYSWLDYGLFLQTVMIAARARGLDTCAQVSFARFQTIIADELGLPPGAEVVCGMSLGYADDAAAVNQLGIDREPVGRFTRCLGFDEWEQPHARAAAS